MALIAAMVAGCVTGALVEGGKRALVPGWRADRELPSPVKGLVLAALVVAPAFGAASPWDFGVALLVCVGAFTMARWSVAAADVLWQRLRR